MTDSVAEGAVDAAFVRALARARDALGVAPTWHDSLPVRLDVLLERLGLGPILVDRGSGRHGGLRYVDDRWHPVVYRVAPDKRVLSARERFTVAHEIAHALLENQHLPKPLRPSEYWKLESICDDFAARLLLPDREVSSRLSMVIDAGSLLTSTHELATLTDTSLQVAARRLLEQLPSGAAWGVMSMGPAGNDARFRVRWAAGARRHDLGPRAILPEGNPVLKAILNCNKPTDPTTLESHSLACSRRGRSYWLVTSWLVAPTKPSQLSFAV